jgi:hypothetical protein
MIDKSRGEKKKEILERVNSEKMGGARTSGTESETIFSQYTLSYISIYDCMDGVWWGTVGYDVFGLIGATFRELDWETLIFFERAVPISPNAWYAMTAVGADQWHEVLGGVGQHLRDQLAGLGQTGRRPAVGRGRASLLPDSSHMWVERLRCSEAETTDGVPG